MMKAAEQGGDPTEEDLLQVAHMPESKAALALGINVSRLQAKLFALGVKQWPYRQINSLDNLLGLIEDVHKLGGLTAAEKELYQAKVKENREIFTHNLHHSIPKELTDLRETLWKKREYRMRRVRAQQKFAQPEQAVSDAQPQIKSEPVQHSGSPESLSPDTAGAGLEHDTVTQTHLSHPADSAIQLAAYDQTMTAADHLLSGRVLLRGDLPGLHSRMSAPVPTQVNGISASDELRQLLLMEDEGWELNLLMMNHGSLSSHDTAALPLRASDPGLSLQAPRAPRYPRLESYAVSTNQAHTLSLLRSHTPPSPLHNLAVPRGLNSYATTMQHPHRPSDSDAHQERALGYTSASQLANPQDWDPEPPAPQRYRPGSILASLETEHRRHASPERLQPNDPLALAPTCFLQYGLPCTSHDCPIHGMPGTAGLHKESPKLSRHHPYRMPQHAVDGLPPVTLIGAPANRPLSWRARVALQHNWHRLMGEDS